jgi:hypothetical protein
LAVASLQLTKRINFSLTCLFNGFRYYDAPKDDKLTSRQSGRGHTDQQWGIAS